MCLYAAEEDCNKEEPMLLAEWLKETMSTEDLLDLISYIKEEEPLLGDNEGFCKSFLESI